MAKIFWFSATGNSFKAAQQIADASDGKYELVKITDKLIASSPVIEDAEIGIVFPVYSWTLPEPVKEFIRSADFRNTEYLFSICTMGGEEGRCGAILKKMLISKGVSLSYFDTVSMPDNCIYLFDTTTAKGQEEIDRRLDNSRKKLEIISVKIGKREKLLNFSKKLMGWPLSYIVGSLFPMQYKGFDKKFNVSDECTSCGICSDVCSVSNISMENGRPVYHDKCIICMACINWCPVNAINYKNKTQERKRYFYPGLSCKELK